MGSNRIPVVGAVNGEQIVRNAAGILWHQRRSHDCRRPACCCVMIHCHDPATISEGHAYDLNRGRSRAIEAYVVGSGADHLDGLADCLSGKRGWDGVVTIEATTEAPAEQIAAKHDLVLAASESFGQYRQDQCLPLISGMDFENAVLFKSQSVDWLQCKMQDRAGRIGALNFLLRRCESRVHAWIVDDQGTCLRVCDQIGRALLQVVLGYMSRLT